MEQRQVRGEAGASSRTAAAPPAARDGALAAIVQSSQDAAIAMTLDGIVTDWNAGAARLYGFASSDIIGRCIDRLIPAEMLAHERARRSRLATGAAESGIRCRRLKADGTAIDVVMSMAAMRDRRGRIVGIASISRPVNEDERSAAHFRSVLEAAPDAIVGVDGSGLIAIVNTQATRLFGYPRDELLGAPVEKLLPEALRRAHEQHRRDFAASPVPRPMGAGLVLTGRRRDGSVFPAEISLSGHIEGENTLVVAAIRDVTARREIESALRAAVAAAEGANQAKNYFLSRMSHELRTPLNAVLGFGQLLARQLEGTEHADAIGYIVTGGRHLLDLVNDVLDIARIEAGEVSIRRESVAVEDLAREALQLMQPLAGAAGVTLLRSTGGPGDRVFADRQRLRQVLLNLLSNAIKYNRRGGHVWLGWRVGNGRLALGVRDDGPGIDPALQNRLFTPFDRLGAETGEIDGTGIGLALARSLAERMGGALTVDSLPGRGSTFTVTLSRDHAQLPEHPPSGPGGAR